jgi:hypothetical protein
MGLFDKGCDWRCDSCGAYMNDQPGFTTVSDEWTCTVCGTVNDVSENNIISEEGSKGYVFEKTYDDGTTEKIRFTKTREVHDFDGPKGKARIWTKR